MGYLYVSFQRFRKQANQTKTKDVIDQNVKTAKGF